MLKLPQRVSDGAGMARIEWVTPVVFEKVIKKVKVKMQKVDSVKKNVTKVKSLKTAKKVKK